MKSKGEITYIPDTTMNKLKRYIVIQIIGIVVLGAIGIYMCINCMKLAGEVDSLILENEELNKAIEMKNSQISDLEENCKDLFIENQELKFARKGIIGRLRGQYIYGHGVEYPEPQEWVIDRFNNKKNYYVTNEADADFDEIVNHSKNILDLIEDEDIVVLEYKTPKYRERIQRKFIVSKIDDFINFENTHCNFTYKVGDKKIKQILTAEQFNTRCYRLED